MANLALRWRPKGMAGTTSTDVRFAVRDAYIDVMNVEPKEVDFPIGGNSVTLIPETETQTWESLDALNDAVKSRVREETNTEVGDVAVTVVNEGPPIPTPDELIDL